MAIDPSKLVMTVTSSDISLDDDALSAWKKAFAADHEVADEVSLEADPFDVTLVIAAAEPPDLAPSIGEALKALGVTEGALDLALSDFDPEDVDFEIPAFYEQELDLADVLSGDQEYDEPDGP